MDGCVCCGRIIPEGRLVCPACEKKAGEDKTMVIATFKYRNGTEESREFTSMVQVAKFVDDHGGAIIEFKASQKTASQIRQGRAK